MDNQKPRIKTTKVVYPQVYSYTVPDNPNYEGFQKIGYTERKDVDKRIYEQTHTAAIRLDAQKLWSAPAFYTDSEGNSNNKRDFKDSDFHRFLVKNNIPRSRDLGRDHDLGTEWFYFNGYPGQSKQLFDEFRQKGFIVQY